MNSKTKRLVAIVLLKRGNVVQSKYFKQHKVVGDPYIIIDRLNSWNADEVVYLNIRPNDMNDTRSDKKNIYYSSFDKIILEVGKRAFMPLTVGGGIKSLEDIEKYFDMGADKISINSEIFHNPNLISDAVKIYGSQAIVASIDFKLNIRSNSYEIFVGGGKSLVSNNLIDYIKRIENLGAGELLINSIDQDGSLKGYDFQLLKAIKENTNLPIIFTGGAGCWEDFYKGIKQNIDAVAASNIFHFSENSYFEAISFLTNKECNFRPPMLSKITKSEV